MRVKSLLARLRNRRGIVLVWTAIALVAMLSVIALAVDLGFAYAVSNELKSVSDAGALAAANAYVQAIQQAVRDGATLPLSAAQLAAVETAAITAANTTIANSDILNVAGGINVDVQFGDYVDNSLPYEEGAVPSQFTARAAGTAGINSFRVTSDRANTPVFFATIMGRGPFASTRHSVSRLAPRNFVLVIDTSSSMDDLNYPRTAATEVRPDEFTPEPWWPATESFLLRTPGAGKDPWFSPHAPGPVPFAGYPQFAPQPLQPVLTAGWNFLDLLRDQRLTADQAAIIYFATGVRTQINMTAVDDGSVDGTFNTLLTNQTLYTNLVQADPAAIAANDNHPYYLFSDGIKATYDPVSGQYPNLALPNGRTNIGLAINQAANAIVAGAITPQSIGVIVLFTDGDPTCSGPTTCYGSRMTAAEKAASIAYAYTEATTAIKNGIQIIPISYGDLSTDALNLLDEIAKLSGLSAGHFRIPAGAPIAASLAAAFQQIATLIPFILVG